MLFVVAVVLFAAWLVRFNVAQAVKSTTLQVEREGEVYSLYAEMVVDAAVDDTYAVLSDYDRLEQLSSIVKEAELLESPAKNHHRVRSLAEACVLFFCSQVRQTQEVFESPNREILALTVPEQSNLEEGVIHWRLQPAGDATLVKVFARIETGFWVPPLIGPWAVQSALSAQVRQTAENIERITRSSSGSEGG